LEQNNNQNNQQNNKKKKNNIKKISDIAQIYAVVTQGFLMMLVIAAAGFLIGRYAIKQDEWAAILGVIGGIIGLIVFISLLYKLKIGGDTHGKSK